MSLHTVTLIHWTFMVKNIGKAICKKKIKKGAKPKRSGRYKLASSALNTDD